LFVPQIASAKSKKTFDGGINRNRLPSYAGDKFKKKYGRLFALKAVPLH
jgi:hypothetical protein